MNFFLRYLLSFIGVGFACLFAPIATAWHLEAGQASTNDTFVNPAFRTITFQQPFDTIPVVVVLATNVGSNPASIRVRNITLTGFDAAVVEPQKIDAPENGEHESMTFDYIAIETGIHSLPNGDIIAAGIRATTNIQASTTPGLVFTSPGSAEGWDRVSFGTTFSSNASVVAQIQTMNSESGTPPASFSQPFLTVAMQIPTTTFVNMALERSQAAAGIVVSEDIGWIAFPSGRTGSFVDTTSQTVSWDSRATPATIIGWGTCTLQTFSGINWANARVVATKNTRTGDDGGWLRRCSKSGTQIGLLVDEDTAFDTERHHTFERAGIIAFSQSFHAEFNGQVRADKAVMLLDDPQNGATNPYALPGAKVQYTIAVESFGDGPIDKDSVVITDKIPPNVALIVSDIDGIGSGPIIFTDGTPSSMLAYNFSGLSDTSDDVEFSNDDGATFTYTPIPGANGADQNITDVRIRPKGEFAGPSGSTFPKFSVRFNAVIL